MQKLERKVTAWVVVSIVRVAIAMMDVAERIALRARRRDPKVPDLVDEIARESVKRDRRNTSRGGEA